MHWLQFTAGALFAASLRNPRRPPAAVAAALTLAALVYVMVVHLPWPLDPAVRHPLLHLALHAGFFAAGAVLGYSWPALGPVTSALVIVVLMAAMTVLSLAEITGSFAYATYPADQEAASGLVMLLGMAAFWVGLALAPLTERLPAARRRLLRVAAPALLAVAVAASYLAG
jgi:uncharacterized protein DUF1404